MKGVVVSARSRLGRDVIWPQEWQVREPYVSSISPFSPGWRDAAARLNSVYGFCTLVDTLRLPPTA